MNTRFAESTNEEAAMEWLQYPGYAYGFSLEIAFDGTGGRLAGLRDRLSLPRVMRGEVRVKEVENTK
jgi:hypothetical protein